MGATIELLVVMSCFVAIAMAGDVLRRWFDSIDDCSTERKSSSFRSAIVLVALVAGINFGLALGGNAHAAAALITIVVLALDAICLLNLGYSLNSRLSV